MKKLFPKQYWLTWLGATVLFCLLLPYQMLTADKLPPVYTWFCVLLTVLSVVVFRTMLFRIWVRRFDGVWAKGYSWMLVLLMFCHLVFVDMNSAGWWCIVISAVLVLWSAVLRLRE